MLRWLRLASVPARPKCDLKGSHAKGNRAHVILLWPCAESWMPVRLLSCWVAMAACHSASRLSACCGWRLALPHAVCGNAPVCRLPGCRCH